MTSFLGLINLLECLTRELRKTVYLHLLVYYKRIQTHSQLGAMGRVKRVGRSAEPRCPVLVRHSS